MQVETVNRMLPKAVNPIIGYRPRSPSCEIQHPLLLSCAESYSFTEYEIEQLGVVPGSCYRHSNYRASCPRLNITKRRRSMRILLHTYDSIQPIPTNKAYNVLPNLNTSNPHPPLPIPRKTHPTLNHLFQLTKLHIPNLRSRRLPQRNPPTFNPRLHTTQCLPRPRLRPACRTIDAGAGCRVECECAEC